MPTATAAVRDPAGALPSEHPAVRLPGISPAPIAVEASTEGITRVRLGVPVEAAWGPVPEAGRIARAGLEQIRAYLAGTRTEFDLPLDLQGATPFRRQVLEALMGVRYGETLSYAELASRVGSPSPRAVGQAVGWNPMPIILPCHRVLASGGELGGYSGGLDRKRYLLALEGALPTELEPR